MDTQRPEITVLMPVFNGERYLREAIESILNQSFRNFEFLIIDDGSTDHSVDIMQGYNDPRIRIVLSDTNQGLIATLNKGLDLARGKYIARMDQDDISMPVRLFRQAAFMDAHPTIGASGTWFRLIGHTPSRIIRHKTDPDQIACGLLFNSMFGHPTLILRKELFDLHGLRYDPSCFHAEDFDLWARASEHFGMANLSETLLYYRIHPHQITSSFSSKQLASAGQVRARQLTRLGIAVTPDELDLYQRICTDMIIPDALFFRNVDAWLNRIKSANDDRHVFPEPALSMMLIERWFTLCYKAFAQQYYPLSETMHSRILRPAGTTWKLILPLLARSVVDIGTDKVFRFFFRKWESR